MDDLSEDQYAGCRAEVSEWASAALAAHQAAERCRKAGWHVTLSTPDGLLDLKKAASHQQINLNLFLQTLNATPQEAYALANIFEKVPRTLFGEMPISQFLPDKKMLTMQDLEKSARILNDFNVKTREREEQEWEANQAAIANKQAQKDARSTHNICQSVAVYLDQISYFAEVIWAFDVGDYSGEGVAIIKSKDNDAEKPVGWLSFAFGSCAMCDAMEAAGDDASAQKEVARHIVLTAHWYADEASMSSDLQCFDWAGLETWVTERARLALVEKSRLLVGGN